MVIVGHGDFRKRRVPESPSIIGAVRERPLLLETPRAQIRNQNFIRDPHPTLSRAQIAGAGVEERRERNPTAARALVKDARKSVARLAALACALAIAGCAAGAPAAPPPPPPLMVQVPVLHQTPCPAPTLARPALPIAGLKAGSPPADTIRAYAAAVAILKGAVRERDAVLAGCARADRAAPAPVENVQ